MSKEFVSIQLEGIKRIIDSTMETLQNLLVQYDNMQKLIVTLTGTQKAELQTISDNIQKDIGSMINRLNELFIRYKDLADYM